MKTSIILGLGYGDEGKGITTDYLCRQSQAPLVIRFSGGHQAGHTVVTDSGFRHVFSSIGSGALQGAPTFWSRFCTFYPIAFHNELNHLLDHGIAPKVFFDALAMVTTPYDVFYNRKTEKVNGHGSCGVGFGATIERNEGPCKLYVQDLFFPGVVRQKLKAINAYYEKKSGNDRLAQELKEEADIFLDRVHDILPHFEVVEEKTFFRKIAVQKHYDHLVFEGSQGLLLDMDHGFFPNVTRAHTSSRNAIQMIRENRLAQPEVFYITRAYQTRHGKGFLSNEELDLDFTPNPNETNRYNPWQGPLRVSPLDLELMNYAIQCDNNYSGNLPKHLVVTCMDQLNGPIQATQHGAIREFDTTMELLGQLDIKVQSLLESHSDCAKDFRVRKKKLKLSNNLN